MGLAKQLSQGPLSVGHWSLSEVNIDFKNKQGVIVFWGYLSEEAMHEDPIGNRVGDAVILRGDLVKRYKQREILKEVNHPAKPAQYSVPEELAEGEEAEEPVITVPAMDARTETVNTGEYEDIWINENKYVLAEELLAVIANFSYVIAKARGELSGAEDA